MASKKITGRKGGGSKSRTPTEQPDDLQSVAKAKLLVALQDGEPVDIPAGRWVDLRVEMPRNSLWNIKQQEVQEAMEIAERERQQNQHDTQSQN